MLKAVDEIAKFTLAKVNSIYDLFKETQEIVKGKASDIYSYELVELLFQQPYCKISFLVEHKIASRNTASKYLNKLVNLEILEKKKKEERSSILIKDCIKYYYSLNNCTIFTISCAK
jgi:Fic family protein